MTLQDKLAQIDSALNSGDPIQLVGIALEYKGMITECLTNEYPGPNHINDLEGGHDELLTL